MLAHEGLDELLTGLNAATSLDQAEKLVVSTLERRYGRGAIALEHAPVCARSPQPTRLDRVTAEMVCDGLYPRECAVVLNEHFIVESELRELGADDVALLENVTEHFRRAIPRLLQAEGRDTLTALPGPSRFPDELERQLKTKRMLCLLMLDLDHFGKLNASRGAREGDRVLVETARLLVEKTRPIDLVFRLQGDEFAVLAPTTRLEDASRIAERIREAFENQFSAGEAITASIGVSSWPDRTDDKEELVKAAKDAMYASWKLGGNRICLCPARDSGSASASENAGL